MAMNFQPKEEKDLKTFDPLPAADYDFDILNAEDTISKSGNPMIKINIGLYVDGKVKNRVFDYLLPSMEAKLRHFCDTVGLLSQYQNGTLESADCIGRSGKARIAIDPAKNGYEAKNIVKDYVCRPAKPLASSQADQNNNEVGEGDIPF